VDDGAGEDAVREMARKRGDVHQSIMRVRRRVQRLLPDELDDVVHLWARTAMKLNTRDLRMMRQLVARQTKMGAAGSDGTNTAERE
jgi:hypothetical protein